MIFCVDFDGTIVFRDPPLRLKDGARAGLLALKRAGHQLVLFSARANRARRFNRELDPLYAGNPLLMSDPVMAKTEARIQAQAYNAALFEQMRRFVAAELPGVFDAIDEGNVGKPLGDYFIDDKSINPTLPGYDWSWIANTFGEPVLDAAPRGLLPSRR